MKQNCLWLHQNQHYVVFKPGKSCAFAQHAVLSISLLSVCFAIQNILDSCSFKLVHAFFSIELISCLLPCAWHAQMCMMQDVVLNNARHLAFEAQHVHCCLMNVLL